MNDKNHQSNIGICTNKVYIDFRQFNLQRNKTKKNRKRNKNFSNDLFCFLRDFIFDKVNEDKWSHIPKSIIAKYLRGLDNPYSGPQKKYGPFSNTNDTKVLISFISNTIFVIKGFIFPKLKPSKTNQHEFHFFNYLSSLKNIKFESCKFFSKYCFSHNIRIFYQNCVFDTSWTVLNTPILENETNYEQVLYSDCIFKENVDILSQKTDQIITFETFIFRDCHFKKYLKLCDAKFNKPIFKNSNKYENKKYKFYIIKEFFISRCEFVDKFILNSMASHFINIEDSKFKSKFELKAGLIRSIAIKNSNFDKLFDSHNTKYGDFYCFKCIFSDLVILEKCYFANFRTATKIAEFTYVTFLGIVNFRESFFKRGLNIKTVNLKVTPNFLNIKIHEKGKEYLEHTNRETYRIIKDSFDKSGNHIEANKFFIREMNAYRNEMRQYKKEKDKIKKNHKRKNTLGKKDLFFV